MSDALYLAGAGMVSRQVWQDAASENVANVSTPGYKATRVFADVLGEVQASAAGLRAVAGQQRFWTDFSQGAIEPTGRDLDLALEGDGFFVVLTPQGERYTRNGNFTLDAHGTLADASGAPVATDSGPLTLTGGRAAIDETGTVSVDGQAVGKLTIKNFASNDVLAREGHSQFALRPGATPQEGSPSARIRQGCLERSNAEPLDETVRMLSQLRGYEASQRIVKMQSETLGRVVNELIQR